MARTLNFDLNSQSKIGQEGVSPQQKPPMLVGQRQIDFSIPYYDPGLSQEIVSQNTPQAQQIIDRINQYIENISDDYLLLGAHLIALHQLLKQSRLSTDQIKTWYAENVNMPYSSAMQCKKVALVYADQPELINRYTASGAYLLSSFKSHEEREIVWKEACGSKSTASIRELRAVLKKRNEMEQSEISESKSSTRQFKMGENEIHEAFVKLSEEAKKLRYSTDPERQSQREQLIQATRDLLREMTEPL
ncbi:MAG: hypothetical protein HQM13_19580 [SAR324 cluster bacterium]|nr:hypothetical protein [SAR324 cluster bacterium]